MQIPLFKLILNFKDNYNFSNTTWVDNIRMPHSVRGWDEYSFMNKKLFTVKVNRSWKARRGSLVLSSSTQTMRLRCCLGSILLWCQLKSFLEIEWLKTWAHTNMAGGDCLVFVYYYLPHREHWINLRGTNIWKRSNCTCMNGVQFVHETKTWLYGEQWDITTLGPNRLVFRATKFT